jgi:hypothetical protein
MSGFEVITVSSTPKALNPEVYAAGGERATKAMITVETDAIRFVATNGQPAASGHKLAVDDAIELETFDEIQNFRAVRVTNDATLRVTYR